MTQPAYPRNLAVMDDARLEIRPPKRLTAWAILGLSVYGVLVAAPVVVAMLVVSIRELSLWTYAVPLLALAAATYFLPFGFGNPLVVRLVRRLPATPGQSTERFVVQLSLTPRLRSGWRAVIEDADDVGWLEFAETGLVFQGDSVTLTLPYDRITEFRLKNSGWRGLFACGARLDLKSSALPRITTVQFAERSSWVVPASRRNARLIYESLQRRVEAQRGTAANQTGS